MKITVACQNEYDTISLARSLEAELNSVKQISK